jgi:hypothetical protein
VSKPQAHSVAGRIRSIEKESNNLIGIQTCDLPVHSIVAQITTLPLAPPVTANTNKKNYVSILLLISPQNDTSCEYIYKKMGSK